MARPSAPGHWIRMSITDIIAMTSHHVDVAARPPGYFAALAMSGNESTIPGVPSPFWAVLIKTLAWMAFQTMKAYCESLDSCASLFVLPGTREREERELSSEELG